MKLFQKICNKYNENVYSKDQITVKDIWTIIASYSLIFIFVICLIFGVNFDKDKLIVLVGGFIIYSISLALIGLIPIIRFRKHNKK